MTKNVLINGDFQVWQRGTRFRNPGNLIHTVDRWNVAWDGEENGAFQISREAFPLGQTEVPGEPRYFARWEQLEHGRGNNIRDFSQQIESVRTLAGQTVTISCYLRTSKKVPPAHVGIGRPPAVTPRECVHLITEQFFGGPANRPKGVSLFRTSDPCIVTRVWQRFTFTTTLHGIADTEIGSTGDDSLNVIISMRKNDAHNIDSANGLASLDIADVQIELGTEATAFERRSLGHQLADCERYFQKSYDLEVPPGAQSYPGAESSLQASPRGAVGVRLRTSMRRPPTVTLYNPLTGVEGSWQSPRAAHPVSAADIGTNGFRVDVAAGFPGETLAGHWTANAEF